ncbi:hypothetical protein BHM03_00016467 [Ensete ventricosum]|uniref:Transcription factor MYC/MYB N-terminal domain-containing protein n=1 Tax=Ensete ventricosum TaxID=4639 RepID=A0A445MEU8_ENSVE|nr:hypothetical protein BHM03_00016467 [Ensete ventricosum]
MVGSGVGGDGRSKEAVGMLALHEALRNVCLNSDWTYSVFWTIRPRPMLMWEDGFCRTRVDEIDGDDQVRKAFSKMSIQLYNYGEGLMGKVASDKCHKWVFKEPSECEPNINYWQSSFDAVCSLCHCFASLSFPFLSFPFLCFAFFYWPPIRERERERCPLTTIPEDLHFVLRMRHMFESLGYQSGFYLSQLFSSARNSSPSPSTPMKQIPARIPPPILNWSHPSLASNPAIAPPAYHPSAQMGLPNNTDDTQLFLLPPSSSEAQMDEMMPAHEPDLKWPNGLSFFTALTGRTDDAKLLFGSGTLGNKPPPQQSQGNKGDDGAALSASNTEEDLMSSASHSNKARKMEHSKFKRSLTLPARITTSSSSSSFDHHHASTPQSMDYRGSEAGIYQDIMETFLD